MWCMCWWFVLSSVRTYIVCNRRFTNTSQLLTMMLRRWNPYFVSQESEGMSVQYYECVLYITSYTVRNRSTAKLLSLNYGAVLFKNISKCIYVRCSKLFGFPQLIFLNLASKSLYRHRLNVALHMSIQLSTISHKFARICATNKQHKSSHY
jgi:hypothetical protein